MPQSPTQKADKRIKYAADFRAEALRLAEQSHSVAAAARALHIRAKLIHDWQKAALTPAAAAGTSLDEDAATVADCASYAPITDSSTEVDHLNRLHSRIGSQIPYQAPQQRLPTTALNCPA